MKVVSTAIEGVLRIEPKVFTDARGYFLETWSGSRYAAAGAPETFVQDNVSFSQKGTLRGLHLQHPHGQGKLVHCPFGEVFDVAVDVRVGSPTFGRWVGATLSGANHLQMYIPPGVAHGFCVVSEQALFAYKCTELYDPGAEIGVLWNDPDLAVQWPVESPILSAKDTAFPRLREIDAGRLPPYQEVAPTRLS